jgi:hypothetical protein
MADKARGTVPRGTLVLLVLGLVWLAAYLWAAHASITGAGNDPVIEVIDAALALPGVIAATMLAGATASVTALGWLGDRTRWTRLSAALGAGIVIGALAGGLIVLTYGHRSSIAVLAWAVVIAGMVGGLLGSLRPRAMVAAGLAGTIAAYFLGFALNYKQDRLLKLFGSDSGSTASQAHALMWLTLVESLVGGIAAGIVAYLYLRRNGKDLRFPAYLAAGAAPGLLLLLAEAVTRIGGAQLFGAAGNLSAIDKAAVGYSGDSRVNHGLVVLFVGAIVALIAFGRSLPPKNRPPARPPTTRRPSTREKADA